MAMEWVRPRIASECLELEACRCNGQVEPARIVGVWAAHVELERGGGEVDGVLLKRRMPSFAPHSGSRPESVKARYVAGFALALAQPPRPGGLVNVLQHAVGHFSKVLGATEKRVFGEMWCELRACRGTEEAPRERIRGWLARHETAWLARQTFFEPYPRELRDLADSGITQAA